MKEVKPSHLFKSHATLLASKASAILLLGLVIILLLATTSSALTITPSQLNVTVYGEEQEHVISIINDEFKPRLIELVPTADSYYLQAYIEIKDNNFILNPREQKNVRIISTFPQEFPPQEHQYVLNPWPGATEQTTIRFRPPGEAKPSLQLLEAQGEAQGMALLVNLAVKNTGNVYLRIRPELIITDENGEFTETSYPQTIIIAPEENYSLTLRQELAKAGNYTAHVKVTYIVDDIEDVTANKKILFRIEEVEEVEEDISSQEIPFGLIAIGVIVCTLLILWITRTQSRNKTSPVAELRKEASDLHKEVHKMAKETKKLIEKTQR